MKWFPHDLATWGFILAVAALILSVPLGVASNLMAPKVQNWWAARSIASLRRRICKLEQDLTAAEANPAFSHFERASLRAINRVAWIMILATQTIIGAMVLLAGAWMSMTGRRPGVTFAIAFVGWVSWKLVMQALFMELTSSVIDQGNEDGRAALRRTIADLKAKLAS